MKLNMMKNCFLSRINFGVYRNKMFIKIKGEYNNYKWMGI